MDIGRGQIVYLNSGSPPLTVTKVPTLPIFDDEEYEITVAWFDGSINRRTTYPLECLTKEKPQLP